MSRAFVKETDDAGEALPELAVSPHPNFVTPAGFAQIEARVAGLDAALRDARAAEDRSLVARVQRDLRYWTVRRASARVVPPAVEPDVVRFGVAVTLELDNGERKTFRLVGEDEADPARGLVSWVAPLGNTLLGRAVGDEVQVLGSAATVVALTA